jgi:hypothetical protein
VQVSLITFGGTRALNFGDFGGFVSFFLTAHLTFFCVIFHTFLHKVALLWSWVVRNRAGLSHIHPGLYIRILRNTSGGFFQKNLESGNLK